MKSKLLKLTAAALMVFTIKVQAQAPATLGTAIINEEFENWSTAATPVPNNWEVSPANSIAAANVQKTATVLTSTAVINPVLTGTNSCKLINTATSYTPGVFAGATMSVTAGACYQVSYYARGKGTISVQVTNGSAATTTGTYGSANGQSVSGKAWHRFTQTVTAPTTTTNAQFCINVKSTSTYTAAGGISITGIDVDSFVVQPYTPVAFASLDTIQYTTSASGNSPFYGQFVTKTGGIVTGIVLSSASTASAPAYSGFYLQRTGATAWGAAYVFDATDAANLAPGDSVTFGCAVDEYFNMTELEGVTNFVKVSSGNPYKALNNTTAGGGVNTQTLQQENYEGFLVSLSNAVVGSYTATAAHEYGQGSITDASGVACTYDFKSGFYAPHGTSSTTNAGYAPTIGTAYCVTGNINYEFSAFNIIPRDSADIVGNCTVLGIEKHNSVGANVYPNPMANELNIQLPVAAAKVSVSITDMMGREVVAPVTTSGANININNLNLNAGTYFVKITADGNTQITKVIK